MRVALRLVPGGEARLSNTTDNDFGILLDLILSYSFICADGVLVICGLYEPERCSKTTMYHRDDSTTVPARLTNNFH